MSEEKLLVQISQMYYLDNKNQNQISKELGIHRSTISKLLKRSREEGIVKIIINYEKTGTYSLEKKIKEKYALKKVIVVPSTPKMSLNNVDKLLGSACNDYLHTIVVDNMKIGFSWGHSMSGLTHELDDFHVNNIICIPMLGGPTGRLKSEYHVNTITYEASKKFNGTALLIDAPAIPETIELKKALLANNFNQKLIKYWKQLDIAIFGIGSPNLKKSDRWKNFYQEDIFKILEEKEVAGDIVSRFFDKNGKHINSKLDDILIGIEIEELIQTPYKICLVDSFNKVSAIKAALKNYYINVLVTTQEIAENIIDE